MAREMKDSGVEWIGEIGNFFHVVKLKYVCTVLDQFRQPVTADQRNQEGETLYDYYGASGIIDKINGYTIDDHVMLIGEDGANLKMRNLPIMYEVNGKAWINNHAHILKPKKGVDFYYLFYALEAIDINPYITGSAQPKLSQENMKNILLPVPDINIQKGIVRCIKSACNELDNIIAKTRVSIEEYKKLKQAVITQVVTKGVRGDREMRDSGIAWIGEIPLEWKTIRIKWILNERKEKSENGEEEPLSMSQKYGIIPTKEMDMIPNMASSFIGAKVVHSGDLVFNKLKAHLGVFAVSQHDGLVSPDYAVYYAKGIVDVKYLEYLFKTPQYIAEFRKNSSGVGAGLTRLYTDELFSIYCLLPPHDEQEEIICYLRKKIKEIDTLIGKKGRYLSEIENYKKSLIYEYVTGKKEVPLVPNDMR